MSANELTSKVRELKELTMMQKELEQEIASLQDAIKAEMTARETDKLLVDVYIVRWEPVTQSRFDSAAFKKTHAELYAQYSKASTYKRFSVV